MIDEAQHDGGGADVLEALDDRQRRAQSTVLAAARAKQAAEAAELRGLAELGEIASKRQRLLGGALDLHVRSVAAEAALAMRVSDATLQAMIARATTLVHDWPVWLDAFAEGRIGAGHLRALERAGEPVRATAAVPVEVRDAFAAEMLVLAEETTPGRLERRARVEADRCIDEPLTIRHRAARHDRAVWVSDEDDGMSVLGIRLPAVQAHGIEHRLLQMAKARCDDDDRTIPNVMADAAAEMLLTAPGTIAIPGSESIRAVVHVTIPATSLVETGYDESADGIEPALLDGSVPLDIETARELAGQQPTWLRLFLDPFSGYPVGVDQYTPSAAQRRWLQARDQQCCMPGCDRSSWECDADHTHAASDGGDTDVGNLAHLCRRHHMLKHHLPGSASAWRVRQRAPGVLEWTTPLGEVYVDRPVPVGPRARRPSFERADLREPSPEPALAALPF